MISGIDYGRGNDESCTITFVSPEYIKELEQENQQLKDRISKAIEYIESNIDFCKNDSQGAYNVCNIRIASDKKLLEILKGENNEK